MKESNNTIKELNRITKLAIRRANRPAEIKLHKSVIDKMEKLNYKQIKGLHFVDIETNKEIKFNRWNDADFFCSSILDLQNK